MEHFTSVLVAFWFVTFILWKYTSLLDAKGWFTVLLSFFGLIHVQRADVRKEKEQEHADRIKIIEDYQDAQVAKHELFEWWTKERALVYKGQSDPTGETFIKYTNLFGITASADQVVLDKLTSKNAQIVRLRQDNGLKLKEFYKNLNIEITYNSNAIEGNRISRSETKAILSGLIGGEGKTLREMDDIVGHGKAFEKVRNLIKTKSPITTDDILGIHKLVLQNHEAGGKYRGEDEYVSVGSRKVLLAMPEEIEQLMTKLVIWIGEKEQAYHPLLLAGTVHYIFARIHPFLDGNGRTARLISNLILMRSGYPPIITPFERGEAYSRALAAWDDGDPSPLSIFMVELLERMFSLYEKELR
jgi:fido (protein-threonine AMPylation protein)